MIIPHLNEVMQDPKHAGFVSRFVNNWHEGNLGAAEEHWELVMSPYAQAGYPKDRAISTARTIFESAMDLHEQS